MDDDIKALRKVPRDFESLRSTIIERKKTMPKRLAQVAAFALNSPDEIAFGTTASIAAASDVQPSTLVRLAHHLGYEGFSDLQSIFRERLRDRTLSYEERLISLEETSGEDEDANILSGFISAASQSVNRLAATIQTDTFARSEFEVSRDGDRIQVARWLMDKPPAPFHKQMGDFPDGLNVDRWQIAHFGPPCFVKLDVGSAPAGSGMRQATDRGSRWMNMWNLNAITPETEKTAHYFFAQAYNFKLDQQWISDMLRVQVRDIFLQDMAMVKAQQINMDLGPSPVVNLGQDKAWVAMRQIVDRLIREEQQPAKAA